MKKFKIAIFFVMYTIVIYSQKIDSNIHIIKFNKELDKLDIVVKKYDFYRSNCSGGYDVFSNTNFSRKEEKKIIKYLLKQINDTLYYRNCLVFYSISKIGENSKNIKTRRQSVNILLKYVCCPIFDYGLILRYKSDDFNNKAKRRMKNILNDKISYFDRLYTKKYTEFVYREYLYHENYYIDDIDRISKDKKIPIEQVRDSLYKLSYEHAKNYVKNVLPTYKQGNIIKLVGKFMWYEFVPILEKKLDDKLQRKLILKNLARMEIKDYDVQLLEEYEIGEYEMFYISTKATLLKYAEDLYSDRKVMLSFEDPKEKAPYKYFIYLVLQKWILNFPDSLKTDKKSIRLFDEEEEKKIDKTRIWLKQNQDSLKILKNFKY